ncbi:MAG: GMC family oxidoreductase N-terminal domain-containing protein, partial [Hyphomicrobiaceae bacterium]|nr:GMC family oxidoreductase N-terminal domain-containing protein [Hyphomicrobiaceae bacterium]
LVPSAMGGALLAQDFDVEFDVVVAGGGSAGCVLATRLTENPAISLCLIEAGGRDRNPWIHIPLGFGKLVPNGRLNWGYETEPEPHLNGRRLSWPRGKVLGGSGSINGLVFLRGAPTDYDSWEALGATGWAYKDVLPYFKRMEHNVRGADAYRGQGGPMTISDIKKPSANAKAFVEACTRLQFPLNRDFNAERIEGVGIVQLNVRKGWRCSTAAGYLKPNLSRKNLALMTRTHVRKILFEGRRAVGVEVEERGVVKRIRARREVIVSGGAINSPMLLMNSGVGPAGELKAVGIDPGHDLPGVGKNLQDHVQARFTFLTQQPGTLNEILISPRQQARMAIEWLTSSSGQLAVGATEATLFARSNPSEPVPDLQFQSTNFSTEHLTLGLDRWPGFGFNFCVCRPKSRGEIKLADGTGRSKPRIFANYFSDAQDDDMRRSIAAFHIGRQIIATEPYRSLIFSEVRPGAHVVTEDDIKAFIRQVAGTVYHPCGTCRMGHDDKAVVDPELRVRGLEGLRVADASVMPAIPSPNIHPATIMIAEKGADIIAKTLAA